MTLMTKDDIEAIKQYIEAYVALALAQSHQPVANHQYLRIILGRTTEQLDERSDHE